MTTPTRKIDATGLPLTRRRALQGAGIAGLAAAFASLPFTRPARADDITLRWWSPQSAPELRSGDADSTAPAEAPVLVP